MKCVTNGLPHPDCPSPSGGPHGGVPRRRVPQVLPLRVPVPEGRLPLPLRGLVPRRDGVELADDLREVALEVVVDPEVGLVAPAVLVREERGTLANETYPP